MAKNWPDPQPGQSVRTGDYGGTVPIVANTQYGNWQAAATNQYMPSGKWGLKSEGSANYVLYRLYIKAVMSDQWLNAYEYSSSGVDSYVTCLGGNPSGPTPIRETNFYIDGTVYAFRSDMTRLSSATRVKCENGLLKYASSKVSFPTNPTSYYYRPNPGTNPKTFSIWNNAEFKLGSNTQYNTFVRQNTSYTPSSTESTTALNNVSSGRHDRLTNSSTDARAQMDKITSNAKARLDQIALRGGTGVINQIENIVETARKKLQAAGYSADSIAWYFDPSRSPGSDLYTPSGGGGQTGSSSGSGGGGRNTGSGSAPTPPVQEIAPTPAVTKVIIRAPFGYAKPAQLSRGNRPQMIQTFTEYVKDSTTSTGYKERTGHEVFYFPYVPNNVTYSGLGSEWVEIPRQGNYPLVEWAKWNLMRAEMEFLIADDRIDGSTRVPDGLFTPVTKQINLLRRMSQRQAPVSIFNMDDMLRLQMLRARQTGKAMQFVIGDLQITATRRAVESVEKEITAATVRLTLQEIPIEKVTIVKMNPPQISNYVPPKSSSSAQDDNSGRLISPDLTIFND